MGLRFFRRKEVEGNLKNNCAVNIYSDDFGLSKPSRASPVTSFMQGQMLRLSSAMLNGVAFAYHGI